MNFFKRLFNSIKEPKSIYLVIFYILFLGIVAGTTILVVLVPNQTILHYILYAISAITLAYFVYTIVFLAPRIKNSIIKTLKKYKFTNTLLNDYGYRTIIFSIFSFILNMTYVIFVGVFALITKSAWYISITVYYIILTMIKGNVFLAKKKKNDNKITQAKTYKFSGIMFICLTLALSGIIVLIYTSNMYFEYAGLVIYAVAAYTFYKLALSIVNIFKAKKHSDLYIQIIRNINLVSACVSILVLQVAMFQAFSPKNNTSVANGLTGALISAIILTIGIIMIIKSNKILKIQEIKNEQKK